MSRNRELAPPSIFKGWEPVTDVEDTDTVTMKASPPPRSPEEIIKQEQDNDAIYQLGGKKKSKKSKRTKSKRTKSKRTKSKSKKSKRTKK